MDETNQANLQELSPEDAKASLGLATRLTDEHLAMMHPPMEEEPALEAPEEPQDEPGKEMEPEPEEVQEQDPEALKEEIIASVDKAIEEKLSKGLKDIEKSIRDALDNA